MGEPANIHSGLFGRNTQRPTQQSGLRGPPGLGYGGLADAAEMAKPLSPKLIRTNNGGWHRARSRPIARHRRARGDGDAKRAGQSKRLMFSFVGELRRDAVSFDEFDSRSPFHPAVLARFAIPSARRARRSASKCTSQFAKFSGIGQNESTLSVVLAPQTPRRLVLTMTIFDFSTVSPKAEMRQVEVSTPKTRPTDESKQPKPQCVDTSPCDS